MVSLLRSDLASTLQTGIWISMVFFELYSLFITVTSAPKYTRRLDFTTGKRQNRGELPKSREANNLGQRTREDKESSWDLAGHTFRVVAK